MSTDIDTLINEVQRLDGEATPGPWEWRDAETENGYMTSAVSPDTAEEDGLSPCDLPIAGRTVTTGISGNDAALCATYRTAAPLLAAEVQRLRAELDESRAATKGALSSIGEIVTEAQRQIDLRTAERDEARAELEESRIKVEQQEDVICTCGLPMSRNPHPDAGKPAALLDVGAVWVCSPCTVQGRHKASRRAALAEAEIASSQRLMADLHDILDRAGLPPRDGYSLRERVRHAHDGLESLRLTLAAEQGLPIGAPDPAWEPRGGLLRTWWRDYRDGTVGTVRGAPDGSARWWRGEPGILASEDGTESRPPHTIAEGTADSKRAAMQAADAVTL